MVGVAIGAAVIGTVGSTIASTSAASDASDTAANTAASNNALQSQIYNSNKAALAPYEASGGTANTAVQALLGLGGDSNAQSKAFEQYRNSTGYDFQLQQGQKSVEAALGAKGLLGSGAALKSLSNYGQQQALGSFDDYYNKLAGQQGVGLTAASAQAGVGQNYANAVSSNNNTAATASENASLSTANSITSALGNLTKTAALGSSYGSSGSLLDNTGWYS